MDRTILSTSTGLLRGVVRHSSDGLSFLSFRGIPYAEAPVGERRFRPPQPKEPWQGTWEALKCGPECPQYNPLTRFLPPDAMNRLGNRAASKLAFISGRWWAMKTIASPSMSTAEPTVKLLLILCCPSWYGYTEEPFWWDPAVTFFMVLDGPWIRTLSWSPSTTD